MMQNNNLMNEKIIDKGALFGGVFCFFLIENRDGVCYHI